MPDRHLEPLGGEIHHDWKVNTRLLRAGIGTGMINALVGKRGTGKTRCAVAVIRQACLEWVRDGETESVRPALYRKTMDLFLDIRATFKADGKTERDVLESYITPKLLVLDEVQERGGSEFEDRMLNYVLDRRYDLRHDTLLISNLVKGEFAKSVGASITSRIIECGDFIEFNFDSFRQRKGHQ